MSFSTTHMSCINFISLERGLLERPHISLYIIFARDFMGVDISIIKKNVIFVKKLDVVKHLSNIHFKHAHLNEHFNN